ncbi:MAG TPA: serine hydrolase domain-containing protein [Gaiellales bacterium]|nr:serine hydrolase domain-containing protein [Gaiellales bacterium]
MTGGGPAVRGTVAAGFEAVREAFAANLGVRGDGGCALAAVRDGRTVVDLWGGSADGAGRDWEAGTAAVVFSGSKGVVATLLLMLVDRGLLDPQARVGEVWPEFATAGKEEVTLGMLFAHAGGVPGVAEPLTVDDLADPPRIARALAAQAPLVDPGTPSYHAITYGWLAAEVVRRLDGRSTGRLLADELAEPLGLDLAIGVGPDHPLASRRATLRPAPDYRLSAYLDDDPDPRLALVYGNPPLQIASWNDPPLVAIEAPAVNAVATARALAGLYGRLVARDDPLVSPGSLRLAGSEASAGDDPLSGRRLRFGPTGYELAGTPSELGPPTDALGHTGTGGTSHGAWPSLRTGFSYVTADLRPENADGRAGALLAALHEAVAA